MGAKIAIINKFHQNFIDPWDFRCCHKSAFPENEGSQSNGNTTVGLGATNPFRINENLNNENRVGAGLPSSGAKTTTTNKRLLRKNDVRGATASPIVASQSETKGSEFVH